MGNSMGTQTIEFNGSYEKHNGVNTYTFVTQPNQTYKFIPQSQTLNYIEIVKAQFYTLTDQNNQSLKAGAEDKELISSRFVFWGYMNFQQVDSFDLFSFGDISGQKDTHNLGLYFSSLYIGMSFMLDNVSGEATDRQFVFDPNRMSFDVSQSTPRKNELVYRISLSISPGLFMQRRAMSPNLLTSAILKVGLRSPKAIPGQSLTNKWYSLLYNLNLGSNWGRWLQKRGLYRKYQPPGAPTPR